MRLLLLYFIHVCYEDLCSKDSNQNFVFYIFPFGYKKLVLRDILLLNQKNMIMLFSFYKASRWMTGELSNFSEFTEAMGRTGNQASPPDLLGFPIFQKVWNPFNV